MNIPIEVQLTGYCIDCRKQHTYVCAPTGMLSCMSDWREKHVGHRTEFRSRERRMELGHRPSLYRRMMQHLDRVVDFVRNDPWYVTFDHNADIKIAYQAWQSLTWGLATTPLASSGTLVAGRETTAVTNNSNLYLDYGIGAQHSVGTTPTTLTKIETWAYSSVGDSAGTALYLGGITGSDGDRTITNVELKRAYLKLLSVTDVVATTSNVAYGFGVNSLAARYGGVAPRSWGLWLTHSTVAALNSTANNHFGQYFGAYATAA